MVWEIRTHDRGHSSSNFALDGLDDIFTLEIHHGGKIVTDKQKEYVGGNVSYVDNCDPDTMSVHEVRHMLDELGSLGEVEVYYLQPECSLDNGLHVVKTDSDVLALCSWAKRCEGKVMQLYCHVVDYEGDEFADWLQNDILAYVDQTSHGIYDVATVLTSAIPDAARLIQGEDGIGMEKEGGSTLYHEVGGMANEHMETDFGGMVNETTAGDRANVVMRKIVKKRKPFSQHGDLGEVPKRHSDGMDSRTRGRTARTVTEDVYTYAKADVDISNIMENMCEDDLRSTCDSSDDEEDHIVRVRPTEEQLKADKEPMPPNFYVGKRFCNAKEFRDAVKNYSIHSEKPIKFKKNEAKRVRAVCKPPCKWTVFASVINSKGSEDLFVKTFTNEHTGCTHTFKNRNITSKWIAARYQERIRTNPNMPIRELRQTIDEDYMAAVTKAQAYRARRLAVKQINGCDALQYASVFNYCAEIKRTHPNTTMEVEFTPFREKGRKPKFMRLYCCLGPLKAGYKAGCRKIIGLDGCHLKGAFPGQILTAISIDANNGWWPIAWAIVEKEAMVQWKWFIELLNNDLEIDKEWRFTFISDQQKGLASAMAEVLPMCEHRYCVLHMYKNFKKSHRGLTLKNKFWSIATSTTIEMYEHAMEDLKEYDSDAYDWVKKVAEPKHWVKAFFHTDTQCDMLVNNLCESFNGHIHEARPKPILKCLEGIREYVMTRIQQRRDWMKKWDGPVGPLIKQAIDDEAKYSRRWVPLWNGADGYQVTGPNGVQFAVDTRKKECACRLWAISGIPCVHAIVALKEAGLDPYEQTSACYRVEVFHKTYENVLYPINSMEQWPKVEMLQLDPPIPFAQPGRPRKARRRDATEGKDHGKKQRLRRVVKIHCRKCGSVGHNAATCKVPLMDAAANLDNNLAQPIDTTTGQGKGKEVQQQPGVSTANVTKRPKKQPVRRQSTRQGSQPSSSSQPQQLSESGIQLEAPDLPSLPNVEVLPSASSAPVVASAKSRKPNLTASDKNAINWHYAFMGNDPPYPVGNWPINCPTTGGSRGRRGRGRGRGGGRARGGGSDGSRV